MSQNWKVQRAIDESRLDLVNIMLDSQIHRILYSKRNGSYRLIVKEKIKVFTVSQLFECLLLSSPLNSEDQQLTVHMFNILFHSLRTVSHDIQVFNNLSVTSMYIRGAFEKKFRGLHTSDLLFLLCWYTCPQQIFTLSTILHFQFVFTQTDIKLGLELVLSW